MQDNTISDPANNLNVTSPNPTPIGVMNTSTLNPANTLDGQKQNTNQNLTNIVTAPKSTPTNKKIIATIFGILLLLGSVAVGVFLIQRQQLVSTKAWDCTTYTFEVSQEGIVTVRNGSTRNEPGQPITVYINNITVSTFDVPALPAGNAATLGQVTVPENGGFSWRVAGVKRCENSGSYEPYAPELTWQIQISCSRVEVNVNPEHGGFTVNMEVSDDIQPRNWETVQTWQSPGASGPQTYTFNIDGPLVSGKVVRVGVVYANSQVAVREQPAIGCEEPTNSPTTTPTDTPGFSAYCNQIEIYDTEWNLLSQSDLAELTPGESVNISVSGSTDSGQIQKARFTVNNVLLSETSELKPGSTNKFYSQYTLPETASFNVSAELFHSVIGWF